jgi:hypothetical protein
MDPIVAATALDSMAYGFAAHWFGEGDLDCDFEEGIEQFTILVMNLLQGNAGAGAARPPDRASSPSTRTLAQARVSSACTT